MRILPVPLGERAYEVAIARFEPAALADRIVRALSAKRSPSGLALLVDERVAAVSPRVSPLVRALEARCARVAWLPLPAGERCKRLSELEKTCEWLAGQGFDRQAAIVGIGGGAATDHAGFAAAIFLRGIDFALVPTTLLSMVDASVGGKTAVDLAAGKNLVGAFHQPRAVACDLGFLDTLPARELAAGMAEVVKAGLIADPALFSRIEAALVPSDSAALGLQALMGEFIADAVRVKIDVVTEDEREAGRRAILNFGHTLGHAMESGSGYELLHGEAVSLGMMAELQIGAALGVGTPALVARTRTVLRGLGLPVDVGQHLDDEVLARISVDKKRDKDSIRFVLVPEVGRAVLHDLKLSELRALGAALIAKAGSAA